MSVPLAKVILSFFLFFLRVVAVPEECREERCGGFGPIIKFPFRLKDRPDFCGYPGFALSCTSENELLLDLPLPLKIHVGRINYVSQEIQLHANMHEGANCSRSKQLSQNLNLSFYPFQYSHYSRYDKISLLNCSSSSIERRYYGPIPCLSGNNYSVYMIPSYSYVMHSNKFFSCTKIKDVTTKIFQLITNPPLILSWYKPNCSYCEAKGERCRLKKSHKAEHETVCASKSKKGSGSERSVTEGATIGSVVVLVVLAVLCIFYFYNSNENDREHRLRVEKFLEDYMAMKPSRYTYADIKKITNEFQEKLGEGAYGTVFKGKLSNDIFVAVKILNHSNGNGEEFINEVGTMGRIHHVNVVRLVGYCADGFRRALVYEFLPNNSLEKYVSSASGDTNHLLSWETLQKIALGIAKGMEYLHQGCDQRILHFDIKPHNILLDHNFTPKISDFGLAKLCSKDKSIVSMTTARGTMCWIINLIHYGSPNPNPIKLESKSIMKVQNYKPST